MIIEWSKTNRGLVEDFSNLTRTYCTTTFTDSEAETYVDSYSVDEFYRDFYVIARHYHFSTFGEVDFTCTVHSTEIELRTILVTEWSVTATLFLLQYIDRSLEVIVRSNSTWVYNYHTTLNLCLINTTEKQTYVITCLTLSENLTEHLNTSDYRLLILTKTEQLNLVTYLATTSLNTTCSNSTTTSD